MGLFERVLGTVSTFFQIGGPLGPRWKDNANNLDARDSADANFVNVRVADPVVANDAVSLEYLSSGVPGLPLLNSQSHHWALFPGNGQPNAIGTQMGFGSSTFAGTATPIATSSGSKLNGTRRTQFGAASSSQLGQWEATTTQVPLWRGDGAGRGGWKTATRFAVTSVGTGFLWDFHIGVAAWGASPAFVNYLTDTTVARAVLTQHFTSAAGNTIPAGTNWQISESDGAGHVTLHDTGIPVSLTSLVEFITFCAPNGTSITAICNDLTTGATFSVVLNTSIPPNTTFMNHGCHAATQNVGSGNCDLQIASTFAEWFD